MTRDDLKATYPALMGMTSANVGDGWLPLLAEVFEVFMSEGLSPDFQIISIKEKLGMLHIGISGASARQHQTAQDAEMRSKEICENCGKPGTIQNTRHDDWWLKCVCSDCVSSMRSCRKGTTHDADRAES